MGKIKIIKHLEMEKLEVDSMTFPKQKDKKIKAMYVIIT